MNLALKLSGREVPVNWESNSSVQMIMQKLSTFKRFYMKKEANRQVADLGISFARNDRSMITSPGDIMLQSGSQFVIFAGESNQTGTVIGHINYPESQIKNLLAKSNLQMELFEK